MRNGVPCLAVWPPPGSPVSLASWCREMAALLAETMSPSRFPENAARGTGQPVVVVPGFCQPEIATAPLRKFLQRQGFAPGTWRCGPNFGPTSSCLAKFERYVVRLAEERGQPVSLVGISLGGTMARELAKHRPDCIRRVVTLCSPVRLPVPTPLAPIAGFAAMHWDKRRWKTLGADRGTAARSGDGNRQPHGWHSRLAVQRSGAGAKRRSLLYRRRAYDDWVKSPRADRHRFPPLRVTIHLPGVEIFRLISSFK